MCSPQPGSAHREFARWKVNSLALERKDFSVPLPLAPEFTRNIRLLGRRPNLQQVIETLIKKYGTHFLLSATLGGKGMLGWVLTGPQRLAVSKQGGPPGAFEVPPCPDPSQRRPRLAQQRKAFALHTDDSGSILNHHIGSPEHWQEGSLSGVWGTY